MNDEKLSSKRHEQNLDANELNREAELAHERMRKNHESAKSTEKLDSEKDQARHEALAQATKVESTLDRSIENRKKTPEKRTPGKRSRQELNSSYKEIMRDTQAQMPAANRAFSKVIHNRAVEVVSDTLGNTIARPNAILSGSVCAFLVIISVYLIARYYSYPLSGSETLIAFAAGWLFGILFDFFRIMITGKR